MGILNFLPDGKSIEDLTLDQLADAVNDQICSRVEIKITALEDLPLLANASDIEAAKSKLTLFKNSEYPNCDIIFYRENAVTLYGIIYKDLKPLR